MAVLGYLPNLKRGLGLAFSAHFQYYFSIKMFLNTLSIDKVQRYIFFSSQDINLLLSSYLDNSDVINFTIYLPSSSKPMATGRKRGEDGDTKI